jgi:hypothetical protein
MSAYDENQDTVLRLFEHGWIALKTANIPSDLDLATERKLFVGYSYDAVNDVTIGPPEFQLDLEFPAADQLGECAFFTEPSILARPNGLFVSMRCEKIGRPGKIVLMLCNRDFTTCDYIGDMLDDTEASALDNDYDGFSASEMYYRGSLTYLIATPTVNYFYQGCLVFPMIDLDLDIDLLKQNDLIQRENDINDTPILLSSISGTFGSFNGACGYTAGASQSGVIYSEVFLEKPVFRLFASGVNP